MTSHFDMPYRLKEDQAINQKRYRLSPKGAAIKRISTLKYRARLKAEKAWAEIPMPASSIQRALSTWGNTK